MTSKKRKQKTDVDRLVEALHEEVNNNATV